MDIANDMQVLLQQQIATLYALQTCSWQGVVADYQACLRTSREQQVGQCMGAAC
jgi:hypothetical protein